MAAVETTTESSTQALQWSDAMHASDQYAAVFQPTRLSRRRAYGHIRHIMLPPAGKKHPPRLR